MCKACNAFGHSLENCTVSGCLSEVDKGKSTMNGPGMNNSRKHIKSPQVEEDVVYHKRRQGKLIPSRSNHKVRVAPSFSNKRWAKVDQAIAKRNKENKRGENVVATSNRFEKLDIESGELVSKDVIATSNQANLESEVYKLSTVVENEEVDAEAGDNDGYIDIPMPDYSEVRFEPVVVRSGIALNVPAAVNVESELGSESVDTEIEEGEVRQNVEHESEGNGTAVMNDLVDEVLNYGTELGNEKGIGETSVVLCRHGEVKLVVDLTDDKTKQDDHVNNELTDSVNQLHKPLDTFLQHNFNENVWREPSPDDCEAMDLPFIECSNI